MMPLSSVELQNNRLSPESLKHAVDAVRVNGYITFESVLDSAFIQELYDAYMVLFNEYLQHPDPTFGNEHFRMFLPFEPPFNDERVIANPFIMPIVKAFLGDDMRCHYLASNTCMPGSGYQDVHSDIYPLFPESSIQPPAYHLVFNIPLVNSTIENGAMEIWPGGTHLHTIPGEDIARLAPSMASIRAEMSAGSLMIRDGRMWHRGTPNLSSNARPNIALVYTRRWVNMAHLPKIKIAQADYDKLSPDAQLLFKEEAIG